MEKTYECMLLLDNREVKQGWDPLKQTIAGMFNKHGAQVVSARLWDERRLAYPIKGQARGTYLLVYYKADSESNSAIRRDIQLSESVLRHMTLQCDEVPQSAYDPEEEFDVDAIPVGAEEPPAAVAEAEAEAEDSGDAEETDDADDAGDAGDAGDEADADGDADEDAPAAESAEGEAGEEENQ